MTNTAVKLYSTRAMKSFGAMISANSLELTVIITEIFDDLYLITCDDYGKGVVISTQNPKDAEKNAEELIDCGMDAETAKAVAHMAAYLKEELDYELGDIQLHKYIE